jgi:recombination protein RecT
MANEIQKQTNGGTLRSVITSDEVKARIAEVLPTHLKAERFLRVAVGALTRNPKLAECTQPSFLRCLLDLSALGLEPDGRRAHLIPYGKDCTLIVDYKGLAELAMRSGVISNIHADVVCENDVFRYDMGEIKEHSIDFRKQRGNVYAVYAVVTFKDGTRKTEVLSRDEVEAVRKRSRAGGSGPWVTDWNEMAKKTAFRRLSKWLPLSPEYHDAPDRDGDTLDRMPARAVRTTGSVLDSLADDLEGGPIDAEAVDVATGEVTE